MLFVFVRFRYEVSDYLCEEHGSLLSEKWMESLKTKVPGFCFSEH